MDLKESSQANRKFIHSGKFPNYVTKNRSVAEEERKEEIYDASKDPFWRFKNLIIE